MILVMQKYSHLHEDVAMSINCPPHEAALKSFFLGPQSENADWIRHEMLSVLDHWFQWRQDLFTSDGRAISREDQKSTEFQSRRGKTHDVLQTLCQRFEEEVPQYSPRYIGHMYSEISLPALLGHFVALLHNPNNISTEAARVGAVIENEAITDLANMVGFVASQATGHFTSGGTVANIEALWRARYRLDHFLSLGCYLNLQGLTKLSYVEAAHMGWTAYEDYLKKYSIEEISLKKYSVVSQGPWVVAGLYEKSFGERYQGPVILVPNSKHYSWLKGISLLGFGDTAFWPVDLDHQGVMDIRSLIEQTQRAQKENRPILMVVSVAGTTELGQCDPIEQVQDYLDELKQIQHLDIWHHIDGAYGGYFCSLLENGHSETLGASISRSFAAISRADSITLDPHKLGYVPYACGAFLVPDAQRYRVSAFDAKYIQSPNESIDRWMKTLEGSRSAAGATATWMTAKTIGLNRQGYGQILTRTILARNKIKHGVETQCPHLRVLDTQGINLISIVSYQGAKKLSQVNIQTENFIDKINASGEFLVSKTYLKAPEYQLLIEDSCRKWGLERDELGLVLLRMTLMNPFFLNKESKTQYVEKLIEVFSSFKMS